MMFVATSVGFDSATSFPCILCIKGHPNVSNNTTVCCTSKLPLHRLTTPPVLTLQYLEWREKQYDVRETVDVFGADDDENPIVPGASTWVPLVAITRALSRS